MKNFQYSNLEEVHFDLRLAIECIELKNYENKDLINACKKRINYEFSLINSKFEKIL